MRIHELNGICLVSVNLLNPYLSFMMVNIISGKFLKLNQISNISKIIIKFMILRHNFSRPPSSNLTRNELPLLQDIILSHLPLIS